jgi:hypothetical protein
MEKFRKTVNKARHDHPVLLPFLLVATFGTLSLLALMAYDDITRVAPQYSAFPPNVEQLLRLALHHTHVRPDPDVAADAYTRALEEAENSKMDPFGKEVLGIRIKLAEMLEKFGRAKGAVEVLKGIARDCEERVRDLDRASVSRQRLGNELKTTDQEAVDADLRKHLLRQVIQCDAKAADVCISPFMQDEKTAKGFLSKAMKIIVEETKDVREKGFSEDNGAGLTFEEIATILAETAQVHLMTDDYATSVQIFNMALTPLRKACDGRPSCREAEVLANMSSAMAMAMKEPGTQINGKPATPESLKMARKAAIAMASQGIEMANRVEQPDWDPKCITARVSGETNLALLLAEDGQVAEAKKIYMGLIPALRQLGMEDMAKHCENLMEQAGKPASLEKEKAKPRWSVWDPRSAKLESA